MKIQESAENYLETICMVEMGVPHLARKIGEQAAREKLGKFVPTLARWR